MTTGTSAGTEAPDDDIPTVIGVDWGTSSFRAYLLSAQGRVLDRVSSDRGVQNLGGESYEAILDNACRAWWARWPGLPLLLCGMVGSRAGWQEVPYVSGNASLSELANGLVRIDNAPWNAWIVPGLRCTGIEGGADVMRGEETLLAGAVAQGIPETADICLPGTHSKWVMLRDGRVAASSTFMTGEMFALLRSHSTLSALLDQAPEGDPEQQHQAFVDGLMLARQPLGLLNQLFSLRAGVLVGEIPAIALPERLSGLLLGAELHARMSVRTDTDIPLVLIATGGLGERYQQALDLLECDLQLLDAQACCVRGLSWLFSGVNS